MLQKVMCGYTIPISKFKANPSAALAEAQGDAIAVSSNNQIQFYAVSAHMYEEIINFVEFAQRGTTELKNIPANFTGEGLDMDQVATEMATKLKHGSLYLRPIKK
ncbi:antitoxin of toxin-antitoxin stability system [Photorhabdus bodei]|uniref:Antitoxin of toxin-antitoxin stability system n=1 Tax=Photorhabdus bodei TaxID=2029681 RepID=A0A329XA60_9GAMM|nr:antitoxin of toxin-antitoxin stability system [Photorhabdus bodei]NDK99979.1 antitoxin of toxin-antitoxin stability system [Photorhabdus bodei]NDL03058.1 antitoxin of toxin-antitoxin stability system [Photorhabdus bodei]NDL08222.1 antitoxin of toxin-antitoxin stability system [Photorhabdus bodei]RAX13521.1 antitoxin of toxin-antitoxin stability system [Photorhabdus bodei]